MDKQVVKAYQNAVQPELEAFRRFLGEYQNRRQNMGVMQAFDSLDHAGVQLPETVQLILNSKGVDNRPEAINRIFDGLEAGIEDYQARNGGDMPSERTIMAAFQMALNGFTEHSSDVEAKKQFDKLSFDHHEALSVVPAAIQVTLMTLISSSLPIVAQLPNPIGSNEVPLIFGRTTANIRMGVFSRGDFIDGDKAGLPYLENRHTLVMTANGATFETPIHVGYTARQDSNNATVFEADTTTKKAPFLGGRVVITVKGVMVANDANKSHPTTTGVSVLQGVNGKEVDIDGKKYKVQSGTADLDNHTVEVTFDGAFDLPQQDEVEVQVVFDYERKDADGNYILTPPGVDMGFESYGIYASPSRVKVSATIDAITQMRNELNLTWNAAVLAVVQNKYYLEQTARLLRETRRACLMQANHTQIIDLDKQGVEFSSVEGKLAAAKGSLYKAKAALSRQMNRGVGGMMYFVSDAGAVYFNTLGEDMFKPTGASYGDNATIYRLGTVNDGTDVYYVPPSLGVFDDAANSATTAEILALPRPNDPALSPFVGMTAVPPIVLSANPELFEEQVGVYSRLAAERNPNPMYANQGMLIQIINVPNL